MTTVATQRSTARRRGRVQLPAPASTVRCAIYTRKSTSENLDNDFNTLHAQREACESYISIQQEQGWVVLPQSYDDGGFSGGNAERPALQRLFGDIERGEVDCVVVYKVDRLSRSLLDFAKMMSVFEEHGVSFVSVTQHFDTSNSMGRLILNVLLSFAQFEREMIGERTSDKMCAARRKGKWMGGPPILGYDKDPDAHRILVNETEAQMVREMFELYIQHQSALKVAVELNRRGWTTKSWLRKNGKRVEGSRWDKAKVLRHLTNATYIGKVLHRGELYDGEHEAIIDEDVFNRVQEIVTLNGYGCGPAVRNKHRALLKGMLRCGRCGATMTHTYTNKKGTLYRYYRCVSNIKGGRHACDTPSLTASDVEDVIVGQIKQIGNDPKLVKQVCAEAKRLQQSDVPKFEAEYDKLYDERLRKTAEINSMVQVLADTDKPMPTVTAQLRTTEDLVSRMDVRLHELKMQIADLKTRTIDAEHLRETLQQFDPLWDVLHQAERVALIRDVVESAEYDPTTDAIRITLRSAS